MFPRCSLLLLIIVAASRLGWAGEPDGPKALVYSEHFTDEALRVDLIHSGDGKTQFFGIEEIVVESLWPGPRLHLLDPTGYGSYRFRVLDAATGKEIFTRGYCSLFGEWLATSEAAGGMSRSMPEPVRFPKPKRPIALILERRNQDNARFEQVSRFDLDPNHYSLKRDGKFRFDVLTLHDSEQPPDRTVDVVFVPDGYSARELPKMRADARRFSEVLISYPPFDSYRDKISVRLVEAISADSGTDEPRKGLFKNTVVNSSFDTFESPRYLTVQDMKTLRQVAALAPYDTIIVMVNTNRYGGGGIYGSWSVFPSDSEYDEYVLVHEFGHGFGGLADEYYSSATGYNEDHFYKKGFEPWEPNITAQTQRDKIKWGHLIVEDTPVPTPDTEEFEDVVGLFEGAGYKAKGLFRPTRDSKMHNKGIVEFGPVNTAGLHLMIAYLTGGKVSK